MTAATVVVMRLLLAACGVVLLAACGAAPPPATTSGLGAVPTGGEPVTLVTVRDGDSLVVALDGGDEVEVRLVGVNAPEAAECHGAAARAALESLVSGATLSLERDGDDLDQYGRLLRYLFADGELVNARLVEQGDALAVQSPHPRRDEFLALDEDAYENGRGMWGAGACGPPPPAGPHFTAAAWDPPGNDAEQPDREWVEIGNGGDHDVAIGGWVLRDESSQHRYTFPPGFMLRPGEAVRVHSGCGEEAAGRLSWCAGAVWSNDGDTAILQDEHGTVVDRLRSSAPS